MHCAGLKRQTVSKLCNENLTRSQSCWHSDLIHLSAEINRQNLPGPRSCRHSDLDLPLLLSGLHLLDLPLLLLNQILILIIVASLICCRKCFTSSRRSRQSERRRMPRSHSSSHWDVRCVSCLPLLVCGCVERVSLICEGGLMLRGQLHGRSGSTSTHTVVEPASVGIVGASLLPPLLACVPHFSPCLSPCCHSDSSKSGSSRSHCQSTSDTNSRMEVRLVASVVVVVVVVAGKRVSSNTRLQVAATSDHRTRRSLFPFPSLFLSHASFFFASPFVSRSFRVVRQLWIFF